MTSHAYSTDNPQTMAAFTETAAAMDAYLPRLRADIEALAGAKGPLVQSGVWGDTDELVALQIDGSGQVPDGWRVVRGRLEPRRGKAGDVARQWLADHQPPDVRHALIAHGLPRHACLSSPSGGFRLIPPSIFEYDGTLWALYEGTPSDFPGETAECTWTPRKLSEFYAAKEANEATRATQKIGA